MAKLIIERREVESWLPLVGYPGYEASDQGRIRRAKSGRVLSIHTNNVPRPHVGLMKQGARVQRGLALLVLRSFVPSPRPDFTTPIHYNGDTFDCRVSNMDWRPRWFALKHTHQFKMEIKKTNAIRNTKTGVVYEDAFDAVLQYGLLYEDLIASIVNKTYVFPLLQTFEWVY